MHTVAALLFWIVVFVWWFRAEMLAAEAEERERFKQERNTVRTKNPSRGCDTTGALSEGQRLSR